MKPKPKQEPCNYNEPCEFVEAEFIFGSDLCGRPATYIFTCEYGCDHFVCEEHYPTTEEESQNE